MILTQRGTGEVILNIKFSFTIKRLSHRVTGYVCWLLNKKYQNHGDKGSNQYRHYSFTLRSAVWDNCSKLLQEKLQKLQNHAARIITGDSYEIGSCEVLRKLNWTPLIKRRDERLVAFIGYPTLAYTSQVDSVFCAI